MDKPKDFKTELCELAYKYGTDKCPQIKHPYTPFYFELLKDRRNSVKKVLEIGIGPGELVPGSTKHHTGASLYMWRAFFPNAQIYGADILPEFIIKDERIETFLCNQSKKEDLKKLIEKTGSDIDLFIDDGSHKPSDQILTCLTVMPLLKKNVIYIIEDAKDKSIAENFNDYKYYIPKIRGRRYYSDDALIVITNK